MRKRKRRVNVLAIVLAAILAFSSAGMTALADLPGEMPAEELVLEEEEVSEIAEEELSEIVEEELSEIAEEEASEIAEEETPEIAEEEQEGSAVISEESSGMIENEPEAAGEEPETMEQEPEAEAEEPEEETLEAVVEEPEAETLEAVVEESEAETSEAIVEEPEAETPEAAAKEPESAVPETVTEEPEEETPETSAEEPETVAEEQVEIAGNEEIAEKKLEAVTIEFYDNPTIPKTYVNHAMSAQTAALYLKNFASLAGNVTFKKISGPDWINVSNSGGISGTPTEPWVVDRTLKINVTDKSNTTNTKTVSITVKPSLVDVEDRQTTEYVDIYVAYPYDRLEYGTYVPSNMTVAVANDYYSVDWYWVYLEPFYYPESGIEDVHHSVPQNARVGDYKYRIIFDITHSFEPTGNTAADNENQKWDMGWDTVYRIYKASVSSSGELVPYGEPEIHSNPECSNGEEFSTNYLWGRKIWPTYPFTVTQNPAGAASIVVGDGASYFSYYCYYASPNYVDEWIHTGGSDAYLYMKVTPNAGYHLESFIDAKGKEWTPEELGAVYSGKTVTLKYNIEDWDQKASCCGNLKFNFGMAPESISLPFSKTVKQYQSVKLDAKVMPEGCTLPITWTSDNPSVATVDENGVVRGVKVGTTVVRARVTYGSTTVEEICTVYVTSPSMKINAVANTSQGVILTWDDIWAADFYMVQRMDPGSSVPKTLASGITKNTFTAPLDGLESGKKYTYVVRSMKSGGTVILSASIERYYIGVTTMNAPTCITNGIRVTWTKVPGAKKYVLLRHIGTGAPKWKYVTTITATNALTQEYRTASTAGLIPGQWYAYTVRAVGEEDTYGGQPAGRSVRFREPVKITKLQSISTGVRATFTSIAAGYTYGLYRAPVTGKTVGSYTLVATVTNSSVGQPVWITDTTAVNGKVYSYYVRSLSKDKKVPLSSYANTMQITYRKP